MWKTLSRGTIIYAKCDAPKNYVDNVLSKCIWMMWNKVLWKKNRYCYQTDSFVSYIYCWYLIYGRLKLFWGQWVTYWFILLLLSWMTFSSHRFTVNPVALAYWQLANSARSLKQKCRHFDEIFITGCTESCQNDNFWCSQWLKFHQNDNISVSVLVLLYCCYLIRMSWWAIQKR